MTDLLALAHERGCESELADKLSTSLERAIARHGRFVGHFAPEPAALPNVELQLVPLNVYEAVIGAGLTAGDAA